MQTSVIVAVLVSRRDRAYAFICVRICDRFSLTVIMLLLQAIALLFISAKIRDRSFYL